MMNTRILAKSLAGTLLIFAAANNTRALADLPSEVQVTNAEVPHREPVFGIGYHPGNFIGPLAFDAILCPGSHVAVDVQIGYWSLDNDVHGLGISPQLQWKFLRGWQTPYMAAAFRYEDVWSGNVSASSRGGALTAGWQFRWQSGIGLLFGVGALYKSAVTLNSPSAGYYSSGGIYGTYEVGVRYFF